MAKLILLTHLKGAELRRFVRAFGLLDELTVVRDRAGLESTPIDAGTTLVSYGTSTIVPAAVLNRLASPAYNIHAASPDFPGRDPHHWAVYEGAARYGATMHILTDRVDTGPIVAVESFDVEAGSSPAALLAQANAASLRIIERVGPQIARGEPILPLPNVRWSGCKRSRRDFHAICHHVPLNITREEFDRRYNAFDGGIHNNLTICLHGRTFRIDKSCAD